MTEETKDKKITKPCQANRFSVCRDVLTSIADYLSGKPYREVYGYLNMLKEDPVALDEDGLPLEEKKVEESD